MSTSLLFSRFLSVVGIALFGAGLYLTFSVPGWVEGYASSYIEQRLAERIDDAIDRVKPPGREGLLGDLARKAFEANESKINVLKESIRTKTHESMAAALAQVRDLDCECREKYAGMFKRGFEFDIALLQSANDRIVQTIQGGYLRIVAELKRDIRIFTSSNIAVFALLLLVSFLRPRAQKHLLVPAALIALSTLICSYFYLFEQNWLLTVIQGNYVGFAYLGYLGFVSLFLADIFLNRARATSAIVNAILEAVGSSMSLTSC